MAKLNPYLNFDGTCEEAFLFYRSVFGGEFRGEIFKMKDIPDMEIPAGAENRVMHVALPVGDDLLMGSDTYPGQPFVVGNNKVSSPKVGRRLTAFLKPCLKGVRWRCPWLISFGATISAA